MWNWINFHYYDIKFALLEQFTDVPYKSNNSMS